MTSRIESHVESLMGTYRKRPVEIQAHRWFANGDHPDDYSRDHANPDGTVWTAQQRYDQGAEGDVVRYYRHPPVDPNTGEISASDNAITLGQLRHCDTPTRFRRVDCEHLMHDHGWIDTLEGGHTVCPGDWIITGVQGEHYPCKPDIFTATYEPGGAATLNQERHPSHGEVFNTLTPVLHTLYGFVPLNVREDIARQVDVTIDDWRAGRIGGGGG